MTFPIANIPLDIWSMAPTKYLYTNTIQDSPELSFSNPDPAASLTGSFEFTATGITRTVGATVTPLADAYGRLPNATEIGGSPYYTIIILATAVVPGNARCGLSIERTGADGTLVRDAAGPTSIRGDNNAANTDFGCFWAFKIPSTTTSVKVTGVVPGNGGSAAAFGVGACYAIPSVPNNKAGESFAATDMLRYELAPLFPVASGTDTLPEYNPPADPAVNTKQLTLPTPTQLNGAPWYYVALSFKGMFNAVAQNNRIAFAVNMVDPAAGILASPLNSASHIITYGDFNVLSLAVDQGHFQYVPKAVGVSGTVGAAQDQDGSGSGIEFPANDVLLKLSAADTNTFSIKSVDNADIGLDYTFYIPVLPETA